MLEKDLPLVCWLHVLIMNNQGTKVMECFVLCYYYIFLTVHISINFQSYSFKLDSKIINSLCLFCWCNWFRCTPLLWCSKIYYLFFWCYFIIKPKQSSIAIIQGRACPVYPDPLYLHFLDNSKALRTWKHSHKWSTEKVTSF